MNDADRSRRLGLVLMAGAILQLFVFLGAASRRSYAALALPVAALSALAFWLGYTMAYAEWDDEDEPSGGSR